MQIIREKVINKNLAQLVLCSDNITVKVFYRGKCIDESAGGTWANLCDSDLEEQYLNLVVSNFLKTIKGTNKLVEDMKKELN